MSKFTMTILKKQLSQKKKADLIAEIVTLCQTFPQIKEYYQAQGAEIQEISQKYKKIIEKEFVLSEKKRGVPKAKLSVARKALNDFKKLTEDPELIADIMMFCVECVSNFNTEFGPNVEKFYTEPEDLFEKVLALIKKHQLEDIFQKRALNVVKNATEGWGHRDSLADRYLDVYDGSHLDVYR